MDQEKKLIVFAEDWGRFPSSTQHLIFALLNLGWDVIWINSVGMRKPTLKFSYFRRILGKIYQYIFSKSKKYKASLPENLTVICPMIIPFQGYSFIDKLNTMILSKQLSRAVKKRNFVRPILWITPPTAYPFYTIFENSPIVYYCCDEYSLLMEDSNPQVVFFEHKLIERASLILVTASALYEKMPENKTYFLDHGVDLELFSKKHNKPIDLPQGKPIAGFYGSITHWVDINLLYQCASQLKDWNFILIGKKEIDIGQLEKLSNVFYLGPKPYNEIPAYSQYWNVGLIPFIKNQLVLAFNPLKAKEYLAGGKPIVSVDIPMVAKYKECMYIAKDDADFIQGIRMSVHDTNENIRRESVAHEGWDSRALVLENKLLALLR